MSQFQDQPKPPVAGRLKTFFIGGARSPSDHSVFRQISLIAFFAWVGLGADGLSSSCYGPQEAFLALRNHPYLGLFVAFGTAVTIFVISASYSQIIELFPTGGGGYLVASKLLSPNLGMISGCALLIDYVLTISVSIASGADAVFSFLPTEWYSYKLTLAVLGVALLTLLNLRGVKESVIPLVPIFVVFLLTHAFAILYTVLVHASSVPDIYRATAADVRSARMELGAVGMLILVLRSYSMGAGTFTGIEAVSNGLPVLREPKVRTAKRTMLYMALSLSLTALGLMVSYVLFDAHGERGKTLNAVLFEHITVTWAGWSGDAFVWATLVSEAAILFVAAQTGFLDGPRVMSNMALDRWLPTRFATLSDRLVTQNGILFMGFAALVIMVFTRGRVGVLVVLYSINVFITFVLSQSGMVRHWWGARGSLRRWWWKLSINGVGLVTCVFILLSITIVKFHQGGWVTLLITGALVAGAVAIKRHYARSEKLLGRLDGLIRGAEGLLASGKRSGGLQPPQFDPDAKTAVILVSGFNGLGLHSFFSIRSLFGDTFKNFAFVQVGLIDAGNFKGAREVDNLNAHIDADVARYVEYARLNGCYAEGFHSIGVDIVEEMMNLTPKIQERFPQTVFFGGQIVFPEETIWTRWLHNYVVFAVQRKLYRQGVPFVILPVRL